MDEEKRLPDEPPCESNEDITDSTKETKRTLSSAFKSIKESKVGKFVGKAASGIAKGANQIIIKPLKELRLENSIKKAFQNSACKYKLDDEYFYAQNHYNERKLYFPADEALTSGKQLFEISEKQLLVITSINPNAVAVKVSVDGTEYDFKCKIADYKYLSELPTPIQPGQVINNSVSIVNQGDNNNFNINIEEQRERLAQLKSNIDNAKDGLLKKYKPEAIELFGQFENCVINQQKDEKLFSKFLKVLSALSAPLVALAQVIINNI